MKPAPWHHLDPYRKGGSLPGDPYGSFVIPAKWGADLVVLASADGHVTTADCERPHFAALGWDHASVRAYKRNRTPNHYEMEFVRELFWDDSELVVQFSVPRSQHINIHPNVLHMWSPVGCTLPLPPGEMV